MASMRAEGFRPAVHCWVLLGCDLVRFVGLLAAEFRRDAGQWVSIVAAVFRLAVRWVSSGCRLPGFVGMQVRGCRRTGSC